MPRRSSTLASCVRCTLTTSWLAERMRGVTGRRGSQFAESTCLSTEALGAAAESLMHPDVRAGEGWAGRRPGVQLGEDAGISEGHTPRDGCRADPADRADMTTLTRVRRAHEYVVNPGAGLHGREDVQVHGSAHFGA